ncbi:MAG TPA: GNAT family protein [Candidatus Dormibacteraeota bacterium]|nr:GNAT family protein [Candidatus Dormibacteraeota bacterium]
MSADRRPIATESMVLEPVEQRHTGGIYAAAHASIDHLLPWMPWAVGVTEEHISGFNQAAEAAWREGREYPFAMVKNGRVVGIATLSVSHGGVGELGYWVAGDHAGLGLATEAGLALLRFSFEQLGLYRVELRAGVENVRSLRVAEKLGFTREGVLRNGLDGSEGPFDAVIFGFTPADWTRQSG